MSYPTNSAPSCVMTALKEVKKIGRFDLSKHRSISTHSQTASMQIRNFITWSAKQKMFVPVNPKSIEGKLFSTHNRKLNETHATELVYEMSQRFPHSYGVILAIEAFSTHHFTNVAKVRQMTAALSNVLASFTHLNSKYVKNRARFFSMHTSFALLDMLYALSMTCDHAEVVDRLIVDEHVTTHIDPADKSRTNICTYCSITNALQLCKLYTQDIVIEQFSGILTFKEDLGFELPRYSKELDQVVTILVTDHHDPLDVIPYTASLSLAYSDKRATENTHVMVSAASGAHSYVEILHCEDYGVESAAETWLERQYSLMTSRAFHDFLLDMTLPEDQSLRVMRDKFGYSLYQVDGELLYSVAELAKANFKAYWIGLIEFYGGFPPIVRFVLEEWYRTSSTLYGLKLNQGKNYKPAGLVKTIVRDDNLMESLIYLYCDFLGESDPVTGDAPNTVDHYLLSMIDAGLFMSNGGRKLSVSSFQMMNSMNVVTSSDSIIITEGVTIQEEIQFESSETNIFNEFFSARMKYYLDESTSATESVSEDEATVSEEMEEYVPPNAWGV